ncbi:MAG: hemerythrin domain-containing protein [Chloroflexi bacterium]|nr:hemerythrin domain-containing protein [Chloroflexota bacterium]
MQLTDRFVVEHQVFLRQLAFLEQTLEGPTETLVAIVETIHGPLEDHAQAEETLLFPALEARIGSDGGPLPVMLAEHQDLRGTIEALSLSPDPVNAQFLVEHLIEVLREHIAKEDAVLFPLARGLLGADHLEHLELQYAQARAGAP